MRATNNTTYLRQFGYTMKISYDILQYSTSCNSNKLWIQFIFVCECIAYELQILQDCCFFNAKHISNVLICSCISLFVKNHCNCFQNWNNISVVCVLIFNVRFQKVTKLNKYTVFHTKIPKPYFISHLII